MSTRKDYDYPRAPLTVTTEGGRELEIGVDHQGDVEIVVGLGEREVSYWMSAADWRAVVEHIQRDLAL